VWGREDKVTVDLDEMGERTANTFGYRGKGWGI